MAEVMMRKTGDPKLLACGINGTLTFVHEHHWFTGKFFLATIMLQSQQQHFHIRNHRDSTDFPILCSGSRISKYGDLTLIKVAITAIDPCSLTFSATAISQKFHKVATSFRPTTITFSDCLYDQKELVLA